MIVYLFGLKSMWKDRHTWFIISCPTLPSDLCGTPTTCKNKFIILSYSNLTSCKKMTPTLQSISIAQCMTHCFNWRVFAIAQYQELLERHKNYSNHLVFIYIYLTCFSHIYCNPTSNSSRLILFPFNRREDPRLAKITQAVKQWDLIWNPGLLGSKFPHSCTLTHSLMRKWDFLLRKWLSITLEELIIKLYFPLLIFTW